VLGIGKAADDPISGLNRLTSTVTELTQIPKLKIVLVLVVVLVLDVLGLCVETRPESSRTISFR
jgi:hypothetical protein